LAKDGLLVVEINEALADETAALFRDRGFIPTIHDDFRGRHRWITANHNTNIR
jgi:methylase of polypeptide subunit release factors